MPVGGGVEAELTRQAFEGLSVELFRRARLPLDQACWQVRAERGGAGRGGAGRGGGMGVGLLSFAGQGGVVRAAATARRCAVPLSFKGWQDRSAGADQYALSLRACYAVLSRRCLQAGVDLGTVVREYEEQLRRAGGKSRARGGKKGAGKKGGGQAAVQIRPKRRQPVSKVGLGAAAAAPVLPYAALPGGVALRLQACNLRALHHAAAAAGLSLAQMRCACWQLNRPNLLPPPRTTPPSSASPRPAPLRPARQVLLVGGATRMPAVRRFVRHMTGLEAEEEVVDPDLVGGWVAAATATVVNCSNELQ